MRAPWRVFRDVGVRHDEDAMDVVPLADVEILRRKAIAFEYLLRRGELTTEQISKATGFARFEVDVDVRRLEEHDVVICTMPPELGDVEDLATALVKAFPGRPVLVITEGTVISTSDLARFLDRVDPKMLGDALARMAVSS